MRREPGGGGTAAAPVFSNRLEVSVSTAYLTLGDVGAVEVRSAAPGWLAQARPAVEEALEQVPGYARNVLASGAGLPSIQLRRRVGGPLTYGVFRPAANCISLAWPRLRAELSMALVPPLVGHELIHCYFWKLGREDWLDELAVNRQAASWGFDVQALGQASGYTLAQTKAWVAT
jgi:hypothetical protein